ncbi:MAG: hypothetical protein QGG48_07670 [Desulfatiglandales bacterium]|nr:hypothetical protein [Desulfatiglandales bacterium]
MGRQPDGSNPIKKIWHLVYDCFPALLARKKALAGYCSGGELQMLVIGGD